ALQLRCCIFVYGVDLNGAYFPRACASDALRQQTDPLEPVGRRFANFFFVLFRFGANAGARAFGTERWRDRRERSELRGLRQQPARNRTDTGGRLLSLAQRAALKDQQKRGGVDLNGAYFPRACASDALRQQTDPLEPAGRRFANFFF